MNKMEEFRIKMKQDCCFIPKIVFKFLGLSFNENESKLYKLYSSCMIFIAGLYPCFSTHMVLHNMDNFDSLINGLFSTVGGITAFLKILIIMRNRRTLRTILTKIEQLQQKYNTEEWSQSEILKTNKKILIGTVFFYIALAYLFGSTLVERFLISDGKQWKTPVVEVTVINTTYSPNFEIAWTYQVFGSVMVSSSICVADFLVAGIVIDLTVQFKIFRRHIKRTFSDAINYSQKGEVKELVVRDWAYLQNTVRNVVFYHLSIIDLARDAEEICSIIVLVDVTGNLCMTCFSIYYASVTPFMDVKAMQSYLEIWALILTLFIMCYCGTEISLASESIATACYETDFVGIDKRFQKSLMMIMIRSQKPVKITVGRFVSLTITVFVWITRSSYSYFMVLRNSKQN